MVVLKHMISVVVSLYTAYDCLFDEDCSFISVGVSFEIVVIDPTHVWNATKASRISWHGMLKSNNTI